MGSRRQARVIAFQTLYRYGCTEEPLERLLDFSWLSEERLKAEERLNGEGRRNTENRLKGAERHKEAKGPTGAKHPSGVKRPKSKGFRLGKESLDFATLLITGTMQYLKSIDDAIINQLENWDFKRLAKVDLAILRISVYCLLYQESIPSTVTIDEAIDIAKEFGSDDSYRFVNGVLDGIRKKRESVRAT